jgi:sterol desaturase/sphingolipid hydroxylase (fatty acid hydroxylase superfamily)
MQVFNETLLAIVSTPVYAFFIGTEILLSFIHHKQYYSVKGTLTNIYLSALNFGLDLLLRAVGLMILVYFFSFRFIEIHNPVVYWIVLLLAEDFLYYLLHYVDHYCRFFWAIHVTHHSSEEFNLTVGFRSSVFQPIYRTFYFIPLALTGFRGEDIALVYAITQIYGILIHTQYIDKLGFLELFLSTPSHHRVHHGSNAVYLDKNMGMLLIIWDKIFGTFQPELKEEPVKYGLTENIKDYNAFSIIFHEWKNISRDLKKPSSLKIKLMYVFGPPGWSHDGSKKTSEQLREEYYKKSMASPQPTPRDREYI